MHNKSLAQTIWYMAHPIAADEHFSFDQNMDHVLHMAKLCFEEGFVVITPYHTHCLILDDLNPVHRKMGLDCDVEIVRMLGVMILTGHKISRGMQLELDVLKQGPSNYWIDLTGLDDKTAREMLRANRSRMKQLVKLEPADETRWKAEHMGTWPAAKRET
jgi:hypothetical protein